MGTDEYDHLGNTGPATIPGIRSQNLGTDICDRHFHIVGRARRRLPVPTSPERDGGLLLAPAQGLELPGEQAEYVPLGMLA